MEAKSISADPALVARRILRNGRFTLRELEELERVAEASGYRPQAFAGPIVRRVANAVGGRLF